MRTCSGEQAKWVKPERDRRVGMGRQSRADGACCGETETPSASSMKYRWGIFRKEGKGVPAGHDETMRHEDETRRNFYILFYDIVRRGCCVFIQVVGI